MEDNCEYIELAFADSRWRWFSSFGVGRGVDNTSPWKKTACYGMLDRTSASVDSLGRPMQRRIDMRFGTWNIRRVHRTDALKTVASELAK